MGCCIFRRSSGYIRASAWKFDSPTRNSLLRSPNSSVRMPSSLASKERNRFVAAPPSVSAKLLEGHHQHSRMCGSRCFGIEDNRSPCRPKFRCPAPSAPHYRNMRMFPFKKVLKPVGVIFCNDFGGENWLGRKDSNLHRPH
jgi:hypothetical protein